MVQAIGPNVNLHINELQVIYIDIYPTLGTYMFYETSGSLGGWAWPGPGRPGRPGIESNSGFLMVLFGFSLVFLIWLLVCF